MVIPAVLGAAHRDGSFLARLGAIADRQLADRAGFFRIDFAHAAGETALDVSKRIRANAKLLAAGWCQLPLNQLGKMIAKLAAARESEIAVTVTLVVHREMLKPGFAIRLADAFADRDQASASL